MAPLQGRENKYTPPARRAPAAQATSYGAPVDPAIISAQIKGGQSKKAPANKQDEAKSAPTPAVKLPTPQAQPTEAKPAEPKTEPKTEPKVEAKPSEVKPAEKTGDAKAAASLRPPAATARTVSPQAKPGAAPPSATSTVEHDVLKEFKSFAIQQRVQAEKVRTSKAKADAHVKLQELRKFANSFKLSTPVPSDLISIIAKDPAKQKAIQEKALQNAEEVAKSKTAPKDESATPVKEPVKSTKEHPAAGITSAPHTGPDTRATARPGGPHHTPSPANPNQRHQGGRQPFVPGYGNNPQFRGDRSSGQYGPGQGRQVGGTLGERLRRVEQERHSRPVMHPGPDPRQPQNGPGHVMPYDRRMSAMQPGHIAPKLNPNSHEFRPNPYASTFNPNVAGPSNGSSPRPEIQAPPPIAGQLIRRKTKAIDTKKCYILAHIKTFTPPVAGKWDENEGLRPSYDTLPTWRQLKDDEQSDSTMHMTYSEYLEKNPYSTGTLSTPNPPHSHPQMAHQHQLPFHLQHGAHNLAPRQSPHMPPMQMHGGQHGHVPHVPFNGANDDHTRMMHSNSAQSYASPRISQVPIGYPPPTMGSPAQLPYNQGVMPPFIPGTPQMNNFRSFSNNPQYMPQQNSPMTVPLLPSQFLPPPNGLVAGGPQMPMYAGAHQQFVPHGGAAPPQPIPGSTSGYPSPGRPAAPMMAQQGSQQGQPMYGVSPNMQFQQPVFPSGHPPHSKRYPMIPSSNRSVSDKLTTGDSEHEGRLQRRRATSVWD